MWNGIWMDCSPGGRGWDFDRDFMGWLGGGRRGRGGPFRGGRMFEQGALKYVILQLLEEKPRHGYEIIRALEERFGGLYSPSAGTVYPRLARLEEEGPVLRGAGGRKAVYRITDAGRAELAGRPGDVQDLEVELDRTVRQLAEEVREQVRGSAKDLRAELMDAARTARR